MTDLKLGRQLMGLGRCPHCAVAQPQMNLIWDSRTFQGTSSQSQIIFRADGLENQLWAVYCCSSCGSLISVRGGPLGSKAENHVFNVYPEPKQAHSDLPEKAKRYLQQAYNSLHAPDAAAVVASSAVDAMLKDLGYVKGTLNERIKQAVSDNVLTKNMADWAHHVRLEANRTRHADEDDPFVTEEEAQKIVEFAEALGQFLFVIPAKMKQSLGTP